MKNKFYEPIRAEGMSKIMIIDTHTHYNDKRYHEDCESLIKSLPENGVEIVINVGCDLKTSKASVKLAEEYPHVYASVGVHPHYAGSLTDDDLEEIKCLAANKKVVAFGETGLDFFHNFSTPYEQRLWFKRQLEIIGELGLPAIIHSRDASDETFAFIEAMPAVRTGVIHAFSGDAKLAQDYVKLGFHIGIGGVVTFNKADALKEAVAAVPLERILLETDCPYLTPAPFRGKRNESAYLSYVAEAIAKIKGISAETVIAQTNKNAKKLFAL
ncbi:MAG: TatD family hydrolase [Defluviitaleaceae bacterium]|nr:TatD family hydrolase [Defluviitaleaceae bacterium]